MFQRIKTFTIFASVMMIPFGLGGCKSKQTNSVQSAPPATARVKTPFYRGERSALAHRPKLLPSGPSRQIETPYESDAGYSTSTTGPNLPLPAPPYEE